MKYQRILLKLSGEALMGNQTHGIDPVIIDNYAKEIKKSLIRELKSQLSLGEEIFSGESLGPVKAWTVYKQTIWGC